MASFFRNELALILGILVSHRFSGRIYKYMPPGGSLNQVYISNDAWPGGDGKYGTGRGGYYKDPNGDNGKPGLGDEIIQVPDVTMCGSGGTLTCGGAGLWDGSFGVQRTHYNSQYQISSGPGGGWFGGGWSMLGGGGGGGSSFVLSSFSFSRLTSSLQYKIFDYYLSKLPPEVLEVITEDEAMAYLESFFGIWYDVETEVANTYPWLYGLNTREKYILEEEGNGIFYNFRAELNGDGAVLISGPNQTITFEKVEGTNTGVFHGLMRTFKFTGTTQEWVVPVDGVYHIIAYGACGGDRWRTDYEYLGGFGGCASGLFYFTAGTKLYIDVGGKGEKNFYQFVNGSQGLGYCTGGGSSSCVRYDKAIEESRILVAGGGGGIFASNGDGNSPPEKVIESSGQVINPPRDEEGNYIEKDEDEDAVNLQDMKFMVNDLSIVHVLVKCYNQLEIPDFAQASCSIYINDGDEGELHQTIKPEGGVYTHEFQFPLNTLYPPDTPTHEVTIEAILKTNFYSIIDTKEIIIWVTTDYKLTDGTVPDNKIKISNNYDTFSFEDIIETSVLRKREITLELEDILGVEDLYEWFKEAKSNPEIDLSELLNIEDWYEKEILALNSKTNTYINSQDVEDECSFSLVHLEYIIKDIEEYLGIDDYIEVELIKGE